MPLNKNLRMYGLLRLRKVEESLKYYLKVVTLSYDYKKTTIGINLGLVQLWKQCKCNVSRILTLLL